MTGRPLFVHACHCTWCQRESGSAFALHAVIETVFVGVLAGVPCEVRLPTSSGLGQVVLRCPVCHTDGPYSQPVATFTGR